MKPAMLVLMACLVAPLAACNQNTDATNATGNAAVVPAEQAEQELMANGFSGERSSGEAATGDSRLGTTGQSNVSGEAPAGATGSGSKKPSTNPGGLQ